MKDVIVLYRPDVLAEHIEVRFDEHRETMWPSQKQIAELFGREQRQKI